MGNIQTEEEITMKKSIITLAMMLTISGITFTGASVPVLASSYPARMESFITDDDWDDYDDYDDYDDWDDDDWDDEDTFSIHDYEYKGYSTVKGTKNFLALRSKPSYNDNNIIGKLHNGDKVKKTGKKKGEYIYVYSPKYDCYGWVNRNYVK